MRINQYIFIMCILFGLNFQIHAQTGVIKGRVTNQINDEPIPFINVVVEGTTTFGSTNVDGYYQITNLNPGIYNIKASCLGFKNLTNYEIQVNNFKSEH